MKKAEKFYRNHYPKIKELNLMDKEIIKLLKLYKEETDQAIEVIHCCVDDQDKETQTLEENTEQRKTNFNAEVYSLVCECKKPDPSWFGNDNDKTHFCFKCGTDLANQ